MTGFESHIRKIALGDRSESITHDNEPRIDVIDSPVTLEHKMDNDDATKLALKVYALFDDSNHTITVTGVGKNSGSGYIALKVAQALANFNPDEKILIVDVNFSAPQLHHEFNISMSPGLLDVLQSNISIDEALAFSGLPGLYVLPAGENTAQVSIQILLYNLTALLSRLKQSFSTILLSAPDISTSHEAELSSFQSDSVIVVMRSGEVSKPQLREIDARIKNTGSKFFGIVLSR